MGQQTKAIWLCSYFFNLSLLVLAGRCFYERSSWVDSVARLGGAIFDSKQAAEGHGLNSVENGSIKRHVHHRSRRTMPRWKILRLAQSVGARALVQLAIQHTLDEGLPRAYSKEVYETNCTAVFEHVYESYQGEGQSFYSMGT